MKWRRDKETGDWKSDCGRFVAEGCFAGRETISHWALTDNTTGKRSSGFNTLRDAKAQAGYLDRKTQKNKDKATKLVAEAEKWVAAKKAEDWTKADFAVAFKKFINGGE